VLEDLFDLAAADRTPERAEEMVQDAWQFVLDAEPGAAEMFVGDSAEGGPEITAWLASCRESLRAYFDLEDPRRLEPAERELYVEALLDSKLLLRGFVDRIDVAPDGAMRVVDYKTGRSPGVGFEAKALFQMRFYALVWWRMTGRIPEQLRLMYLKVADDLTHSPTAPELERFEGELARLWASIVRDGEFGDFRPKKSKLCGWCSFQELCPAFGGTPPEYPGWPGAHGE